MASMSTRPKYCAGALVACLAALALLSCRATEEATERSLARAPVAATTPADPSTSHTGFLHGRITTRDGSSITGRLRWGGDEEAFYDNYFNGWKAENPWAHFVPPERLTERTVVEIFGIQVRERERPLKLERPFMVRFGDLSHIEVEGNDIRVTAKNGTTFTLDRLNADDIADGVRVWDSGGRSTDLSEPQIRRVEILPAVTTGPVPTRLHGTVDTSEGDFTGFIHWNRRASVDTDELTGQGDDGDLTLAFKAIRSISRLSSASARVTLRNGSEVTLSGTEDVGQGNRGIEVEDSRFGTVRISWQAFSRLTLNAAGSGRAYADFPPGQALQGNVELADGGSLSGRLVYDLDESTTFETLDAPWRGLHFSIPFGLIATITRDPGTPGHTRISLHGGEELELENHGDLAEDIAGILVFTTEDAEPEYLAWSDVTRVDFSSPVQENR